MLAKEQAISIVHQTGEKGFDATRAAYEKAGVAAECTAFIKDMAAAYHRADLIIGRPGHPSPWRNRAAPARRGAGEWRFLLG